jgi:TRAP-type C4-dicarboxylate transport system substrate-binding protein
MVVALALITSVAGAAPTLRVGTLAPDGTAWAREVKAFVREVDPVIKVKVYFGGIAGDEKTMVDRARRGQLDAIAGVTSCYDLSPSLRVSRLQGVFNNTDQAARFMRALPRIEDEFKAQGFVNLGIAGFGPSIVFTRSPVKSWSDLTKLRLWRWDADPVAWQQDKLMGMNVQPLPLDRAITAFDEGKLDGFIGVAASSLAFQWHSRAPYVVPLEVDHIAACWIITSKVYDSLPIEARDALRTAAAKLQHRLELVGAQLDHTVESGGLVGRGIQVVPVSSEMRKDFLDRAISTRKQISDAGVVHQAQIDWLEQWLKADQKSH